MLTLFVMFFMTSLSFLMAFFMVLPGDLKKQSIRPLFLLLFVIGFWAFTSSAFTLPGLTTQVTGTNPSNSVVNAPTAAMQSSFITIYWIVMAFDLFMALLWYLLLLREKAGEAMEKGADTMSQLEKRGWNF